MIFAIGEIPHCPHLVPGSQRLSYVRSKTSYLLLQAWVVSALLPGRADPGTLVHCHVKKLRGISLDCEQRLIEVLGHGEHVEDSSHKPQYNLKELGCKVVVCTGHVACGQNLALEELRRA
jgi:hypothetical protein